MEATQLILLSTDIGPITLYTVALQLEDRESIELGNARTSQIQHNWILKFVCGRNGGSSHQDREASAEAHSLAVTAWRTGGRSTFKLS
jgi:hypothetical protein